MDLDRYDGSEESRAAVRECFSTVLHETWGRTEGADGFWIWFKFTEPVFAPERTEEVDGEEYTVPARFCAQVLGMRKPPVGDVEDGPGRHFYVNVNLYEPEFLGRGGAAICSYIHGAVNLAMDKMHSFRDDAEALWLIQSAPNYFGRG